MSCSAQFFVCYSNSTRAPSKTHSPLYYRSVNCTMSRSNSSTSSESENRLELCKLVNDRKLALLQTEAPLLFFKMRCILNKKILLKDFSFFISRIYPASTVKHQLSFSLSSSESETNRPAHSLSEN